MSEKDFQVGVAIEEQVMKERIYIELIPTECYGNFQCPDGAERLGLVSSTLPIKQATHRIAVYEKGNNNTWTFVEMLGPF